MIIETSTVMNLNSNVFSCLYFLMSISVSILFFAVPDADFYRLANSRRLSFLCIYHPYSLFCV